MLHPPTPRSPRARRALRLGAAGAALSLAAALSVVGANAAFAADAFFPPVAADDAYSMVQGGTLTIGAPEGLLANDTFSDAGPLDVSGLWAAAGHTIVVHPEGGFSFTPDPAFVGSYTFQYQATDETSHLSSEKATVTITVTPKPNSAPIAKPDAYSMVQGGTFHIDTPGVLANDSDPDGDALTVSAVQGHDSATTVLNTEGWLTYTPAPSFTGVVSFQYRVSDGQLTSDWTTVTITVTPKAVAEPPVAHDDHYTTTKNVPLVVSAPGVLVNDSDPAGSIADWLDNANEVVMTLDGGFVYTPAKDFVGTKTFTYNMAAAAGDDVSIQSNWATVTITVTAPNIPAKTDEPEEPAGPTTDQSTPAGHTLAQTGGSDSSGLAWAGAAFALLGAGGIGISLLRRRIANGR